MRKAKRLLSPSRLALITGGLLGLGLMNAGPAQADLTFVGSIVAIDGNALPASVMDAIPTAGNQSFTVILAATVTSPDAAKANAFFTTQGTFNSSTSGTAFTGAYAAGGSVSPWPPPVTLVGLDNVDPYLSYIGYGATGGTAAGGSLTGVVIRHTPQSVYDVGLGKDVLDPNELHTGPVYTTPNIGKVVFTGNLPSVAGLSGTTSLGYQPTMGGEEGAGWTESMGGVATWFNSFTGAAKVTGTQAAATPKLLAGSAVTMTNDTAISVRASESFDITSLSNPVGKTLYVVGSGTVNINGVQAHGTGAVLDVNGGTVNVASDAGPVTANLIVNARSGNVNFTSTQHINELNILGDTAGAAILGNTPGARKVLVTNKLSLAGDIDAWTNSLDLDGNAMVINVPEPLDMQAAMDRVMNMVKIGQNGGTWDGKGIRSTAAQNDSNFLTGIELLNNQNWFFPDFMGETLDGNARQILLRYTYLGDATLDGFVDGGDLDVWISAYQSGGTALGFENADFNYDGLIDGGDLDVWITGYQMTHGGGLPENIDSSKKGLLAYAMQLRQAVGTAAVPVPEPASLVLVLGAAGLLFRRRRS